MDGVSFILFVHLFFGGFLGARGARNHGRDADAFFFLCVCVYVVSTYLRLV